MNLAQLKTYRKLQRIPITEVANRTGLHRNQIANIENGKTNPTLETLEKIAASINLAIEFRML